MLWMIILWVVKATRELNSSYKNVDPLFPYLLYDFFFTQEVSLSTNNRFGPPKKVLGMPNVTDWISFIQIWYVYYIIWNYFSQLYCKWNEILFFDKSFLLKKWVHTYLLKWWYHIKNSWGQASMKNSSLYKQLYMYFISVCSLPHPQISYQNYYYDIKMFQWQAQAGWT